MARYLVITQHEDGTGRSTFSGSNHRRLVKWARAAHNLRRDHVTVIRADTGNVVIWLGTDFSKEKQS